MSGRALVTGLGVVAPAGGGDDGAALWERLRAGAPAPLVHPPARRGLKVPPACVFPKDFRAEDYVKIRALRKATNLSRMATVAARRALDDAGAEQDDAGREATAVVMGTCFGCSAYYLKFHDAILRRGPKGANAVLFTESVFNAAAGHVSMAFGLHGPSLAVAGGEEAGLSALVAAADRLHLAGAGAALSGGGEEYSDLVHRSLLSEGRVGVEAAGAGLDAPGPFAEGAVVALLEAPDTARARGAQAYAAVLGSARARPRPDAAPSEAVVRAVRRACAEADVAPAALDLVIGGGAGGPRSAREREALEAVFPADAAERPWYVAPQGSLGEGFGYTSAAAFAIGARALASGRLPASFGAGPAPAGLRLAEGGAEAVDLTHALVVATSEPGGAVACVLGPPPEGLARGA